jgi:hypothetical protein
VLSVPAWEFEEEQHNLQATPSASVPGTSIVTGATPHTKTAWASLIDPVNFDVYWMTLGFANTFVAATDTRGLFDLGIGPTGGGSENVVLPNLLVGSTASYGQSTGAWPRWISLPLYIPAGVRISGRWQSARAAATTLAVAIWLWGGPGTLPFQPYVGCDAYGVTTASSSGAPITAGNTGAESAWASVGSTTSKNYDAILPMAQAGSGTVYTGLAYHYEFGYSSTTLGERVAMTTTSEIFSGLWPGDPIYRPVQSGTQLQVRGECSGVAEAHEVALYGLYN